MGPVVLSVAATNIMLVITTMLASRGQGWAATLNYAFRLVHLPIGLIGVALGTVVLAAGSRARAGKAQGDDVDDVVRRGLRLNWLLALPAAVGLAVLADPIVAAVYQWGRFDDAARTAVASALRWYCVGVLFYAGVKAAAPQFLAHDDTRTPMRCALLGIGANLTVALAFIGALGVEALALAVAVGAAINYAALRWSARRRFGAASAPGAGYVGRVVVAATVMGALGWVAGAVGPLGDGAGTSRGVLVLTTLAAILLLGGTYFVVAAGLGIDEARTIPRWLWRSRERV